MTAKLTAAEIATLIELGKRAREAQEPGMPVDAAAEAWEAFALEAARLLPDILDALDDAGRALEEANEIASTAMAHLVLTSERASQAELALAAANDEAGRLRDLLKSHERAGLRLESERDAAISRASKAEGERDEALLERDAARRMYCVEATCRSEEDFTPRQICEDVWPSDADRLFPDGEVK